ncbi:MAG: hypothetical protein DRG37_06520 [Deltaproteobacteria bacterium]|nr:MAG: hypothetical protein DRG37_06520 [Deltaproteobacteria bacterium]
MEEPMWREVYKAKKVRPEDILSAIRPGSKVYIETGCAEPRYLVEKLIVENNSLADIEIYTTMPLSSFSEAGGDYGSRFRVKAFFVSPEIVPIYESGNTDHLPVTSFGLSRLIKDGYLNIDTAIIHVSLPDEYGYMSLGISVDVTRTVIDHASTVIAQVNKNMPRTLGDGFVHVSKISYIIEHDDALIEDTSGEPDDETRAIGENIARLIENGSTIQIGFGRLPSAALYALRDKGVKDLGIHTEILTDPVCALVEEGLVNGKRKSLDAEKIVASMCLGTRKLFDFVNQNPMVELRSPDYTSSMGLISRQKNMVAINGALEVDLTGQSCVALSDGTGFLGTLGHADFNRGAMASEGGKSIIALRSTTRDGRRSRIVPEFTDLKIGVVTTQAEVNYVVTEYGEVNLFGKTIRERALALITIAHPRFRKWLLEEAKRLKYVYLDQILPPEDTPYPFKYEKTVDLGGTSLLVRPVKVTDERSIQDLFYAMSLEDKFFRFLHSVTVLHHKQAQRLVNVDYRKSMALVTTRGSGMHDNRVLAVAHYAVDNEADSLEDVCEFSIMVHPEWQNRGIGYRLLNHIIDIARDNGFRYMSSSVWEDNTHMLHLIKKTGYRAVSYDYFDHVYSICIDITRPAA